MLDPTVWFSRDGVARAAWRGVRRFVRCSVAGIVLVLSACGGNTDVDGTGGACPGCDCTSGEASCDGTCVDLLSHSSHCGACGVTCGAPEVCVDGACGCPEDGAVCGDACVVLASDELNCGSCENECSGEERCIEGKCACANGLTSCSGACVNLDTSRTSCGACSNDCLSVESCDGGSCVYGGADGDGCGNAARDIDVVKVALYQAVEAPLVDEGEIIPVSERDTLIVAGRDAVVRVFVDAAVNFEPRELSARLTVDTGGESHVLFAKQVISGDSSESSVNSTLVIDVPGALLAEDSEFRVDLVECEGHAEGEVGAVRFPTGPDARSPLGVTTTGAVTVVFVPVVHDGLEPDTSPEALAIYAAVVEKEFPTTQVLASVTSAIDSQQDGVAVDFEDALDVVADKRALDEPAPDVYYYGLIRPAASLGTYCAGPCTLGIAFVASGGVSGAADRVGLGIGYVNPSASDASETDDRLSYETFLHELGHNHGREHVDCGNPDDPDPNYPYGGGRLGTWGFDVEERQPKDPDDYRDFMSYCDPYWVSDYTWNAVAARITNVVGLAGREWSGAPGARVLGEEPAASSPPVRFRVMSVGRSGARWLRRVATFAQRTEGVESASILDVAGRELLEVAVYRVKKSTGDGSVVYVPEPASDWAGVLLADGTELAFE